jgi:hypothetical protein
MNLMADSEPSRSTIKRLFALSGNRCAFPKCQAPMALDETLVGEVGHIKGKQPGAARYDRAQTPAERHAYENLILLCAPHHTVIDDDEEAYTVERLRKMKAEHEARATPISEKDADHVAAAYSTDITVGQSGGIAANNFAATHFTLNAGHATDSVSKRQLEALENLWAVILNLRNTFGAVVYVDTVLLADEIAEYFKTGRYHQVMDAAREYADPQCVAKKIISVHPDRERPFVNNRIYSIVFLLRALYGRTALLIAALFFYLFAAVCVASAVMVIAARNPVDSVQCRQDQAARFAVAYCNNGCIGAPGPIFWRLPLMTLGRAF